MNTGPLSSQEIGWFFWFCSLGFGDEAFLTLTQQMCAIITSFAKHKTILSKSCHVNHSLSAKM